jgi:hypothetical protein
MGMFNYGAPEFLFAEYGVRGLKYCHVFAVLGLNIINSAKPAQQDIVILLMTLSPLSIFQPDLIFATLP